MVKRLREAISCWKGRLIFFTCFQLASLASTWKSRLIFFTSASTSLYHLPSSYFHSASGFDHKKLPYDFFFFRKLAFWRNWARCICSYWILSKKGCIGCIGGEFLEWSILCGQRDVSKIFRAALFCFNPVLIFCQLKMSREIFGRISVN